MSVGERDAFQWKNGEVGLCSKISFSSSEGWGPVQGRNREGATDKGRNSHVPPWNREKASRNLEATSFAPFMVWWLWSWRLVRVVSLERNGREQAC